MKQLSRPDEIWVLTPTGEDLRTGARYAAITLPWTFNRMMMSTSSRGQQWRALNIAKGIVGQEVLRRALVERGIPAQAQRKSHRDEDLFDFVVARRAGPSRVDVKSVNYYGDYPGTGREPFSAELIVENAAYPGPDWRRFFPMLVPRTQIRQKKDAYCFAVASSIDFRRDIDTNRIGYALTAFPYGECMAFTSFKRLCLEREKAGEGFYVECSYRTQALPLLNAAGFDLTILGEWDGLVQRVRVHLRRNSCVSEIGPFSCVSSFQVGRVDHDRFSGRVEISVCRNDFRTPVLNSRKRNVNEPPHQPMVFTRKDFCNLVLPSDYTLYFIGWMPKERFLSRCRDYSGWVWPNDRIDKYCNQPWTQLTERDLKDVSASGFGDCIEGKPRLLAAGWMKTTGRGGGACCYVFPNLGGARGGVRETNLYVLPQDLLVMDELGRS